MGGLDTNWKGVSIDTLPDDMEISDWVSPWWAGCVDRVGGLGRGRIRVLLEPFHGPGMRFVPTLPFSWAKTAVDARTMWVRIRMTIAP